MKKLTKFFMAALLAGMCCLGYAQTQPNYDYLKAPKPYEKVLGVISLKYPCFADGNAGLQEFYRKMLENAKKDYPEQVVDIREMKAKMVEYCPNCTAQYYFDGTGKVVDLHDPEAHAYGDISQAINKAFRNVCEGSRIAIDQVTVLNSMNREDVKDHIIDVLLDKGYKVVAKEYLDKLYEEQQAQQSGIYNDRTIVQDNNFSAVGYYVNVKVTETSLRVQVINVSTGEYEGNATVNF